MQPCINDISMHAIYAWMNECMNMHKIYMTTWLWDCWDKTRQVQKRSGPTSQHKHSAISNEDNITGDELTPSR